MIPTTPIEQAIVDERDACVRLLRTEALRWEPKSPLVAFALMAAAMLITHGAHHDRQAP